MPLIVGFLLSVGVASMAWLVGLDRSRAFYPTVLMVVGSYYVLFAAMAGSTGGVLLECAVMVVFLAAAIAGFRSSAWIVVAGLAAHGLFDAYRDHFIAHTGAPAWWPPFCMAFDVGAAAWLALILLRRASNQVGDAGESL
ncbi:MAG: hypothetical protein U1F30_02500 [Steroidobacteraceae bacterium]